jgi:hypothetical protein
MSRENALTIFQNKLGRHDNSDDTGELAAALELMPAGDRSGGCIYLLESTTLFCTTIPSGLLEE